MVSRQTDVGIGGKALGMQFLDGIAADNSEAGFSVPRWIVIGPDLFAEFCVANRIPTNHNQISSYILGGKFHESLKSRISRAMSNAGICAERLAVRSNGGREDSVEHSFAGVYDSVIGIERAELFQAVQAVWASFFSERAVTYQSRANVFNAQSVSIIIQEFIEPDASGVVFSRIADDRGRYEQIRIEALYGLGEGLVSGQLDCDRFDFDRATESWTRKIVSKDSALRCGQQGKGIVVEVESGKRKLPCLEDEILQSLVDLTLTLEARFECAIDLEFVVRGQQIFLVQIRPITTAMPLPAIERELASEDVTVWDNANIIESYSGLTLPLTFSHLRAAYAQVYRQFAESMGVNQAQIRRNLPTFANMLGLIQGRVYYNLLNWYRLIYLLPNAERSAGFMEGMMGVRQALGKGAAGFEKQVRQAHTASRWENFSAATYSLLQLLANKRQNVTFMKTVRPEIHAALSKNFEAMSVGQLIRFYDDFCEVSLGNWRAPIVNDTRCMLLSGILRKRLIKYAADGRSVDEIFNQIVNSDESMISSAMAVALKALVEDLRTGRLRGRELFQDCRTPGWAEVAGDNFKALRGRIENYINQFGFRCADELKFDTSDLHDDPAPLFNSIRSALAAEVSKETYEASPVATFRLGTLDHWLAKHTAQAIADRENMRYVRTEAFAVARRLFRAVGRRLAEYRLLDSANDVHYLTVDELRDFNLGRGVSGDLRAIVSARKNEYAGFSKVDLPDRFVSRGTVGLFQSRLELLTGQAPEANLEADHVSGTPCAPGRVTAEVFVAKDFAAAQHISGQILVTERTDPGWISLYPACRGLIIERGSTLSHAAVVAREMGIPTIVGVAKATQRLAHQSTVTMDGGTGKVVMS